MQSGYWLTKIKIKKNSNEIHKCWRILSLACRSAITLKISENMFKRKKQITSDKTEVHRGSWRDATWREAKLFCHLVASPSSTHSTIAVEWRGGSEACGVVRLCRRHVYSDDGRDVFWTIDRNRWRRDETRLDETHAHTTVSAGLSSLFVHVISLCL